MSSTVFVLRALVAAEPLLTLTVLLICLAQRLRLPVRAIRDYLIARLAVISIQLAVLCLPWFIPSRRALAHALYFYIYWVSSFILAGFLCHVAGSTLRHFLRMVTGLPALSEVAYRWLLIAGLFLLLPVMLPVAEAIAGKEPSIAMQRFMSTFSLAQLLPLTFVLGTAIRLRVSPKDRVVGFLLGLSLEPAVNMILAWFYDCRIWGLSNLMHQIVTEVALILWVVYFLLPERRTSQPLPGAALLRWDEIARRALRYRWAPGRRDPEGAMGLPVSEEI